MSDTSYSVELKGLDLPDNVRNQIETTLRSAVMGELAKLDLGKNLKVEPLPAAGERQIGLMGFIIRNLPKLGGVFERDAPRPAGQSLPFFGGSFGDAGGALMAGSSTEALEVLYLRPDVKAAVISNSRAFSDMLSRDEEAARAFNALVGGLSDTERIAPLVIGLILLGSAASGAAIGWYSRR